MAVLVFVCRFALAYLTCQLVFNTAYADLNSEGELSIDWLVDSCDEIYIAEVITPQLEFEQPPPKLLRRQTLKSPPGDTPRNPVISKADKWRFWSGKSGDEWLCFVRHDEKQGTKVVKAVDLSHPRLRSYSAAITVEGEVLATKKAILAAVTERLKLNRRLPQRFEPQLVENALSRHDWHPMRNRGEFSPRGMEYFVGGFPYPIVCDKWSLGLEEYGGSSDILITHLVVPADQKFRDHSCERISAFLKGDDVRMAEWLVYSLVNYPDRKVRELLDQLAAVKRHEEHKRPVLSRPISVARNILRYWKFLDDIEDPINTKLIGTWKITYGQTKRTESFSPTYAIQVLLREDHSMQAIGYDERAKTSGFKKPIWEGSGYWVAAGKSLTIASEETKGRSDKLGDSWAAAEFEYRTVLKNAQLNNELSHALEESSGRVAEWVGPEKVK